jgi:CubicO group peptidase (beta-lactamase class C family)
MDSSTFFGPDRAIAGCVAQAIAERVFPGCVIGVISGDGPRVIRPYGAFTYEAGAEPMRPDSIFDVASITKSIPTATLALKAVEEGALSLAAKAIDWLPELSMERAEEITLRHLLTHSLDFGYALSAFKDRKPAAILEHIFTTGMRSVPGATFFYSNTTSILLGLLVERVFKQRLDVLADTILFKPIAMNKTTFHPPASALAEIVPTEVDAWRGTTVRGMVHDESAFALSGIMTPGSAGLFSTVTDLLNFLWMLLNQGHYGDNRILRRETIAAMQINRLDALGETAALGWELNRRKYMGAESSDRTIGKTGFTGCAIMCDCSKRTGLVILSNYTWPHRKPDAMRINAFRAAIADIVFR